MERCLREPALTLSIFALFGCDLHSIAFAERFLNG
jgi:hypothetical protein